MSVRRGAAPPALAVPGNRLDAVLACGVGVAPSPAVHRPSGADVRETLDKLFGDSTPDRVARYIYNNRKHFNPSAAIVPHKSVMERDSGRVGEVQDMEYWRTYGGVLHPAVIYDDRPGFKSTAKHMSHFIVIVKDQGPLPLME